MFSIVSLKNKFADVALFVNSLIFYKGVFMEGFKFPVLTLWQTLYTLEQLKSAASDHVHIAFAGRSNVGKSSLINALARRKQLAKISSTPGKTRSVNLYHVTPQDFYLTDLPGYGYAKRSKGERELWGQLIENYLLESENVAAVAILLDCRLEPQDADKQMVAFTLGSNIPIIPILTKSDKCSQKERLMRQSQWQVLLSGTLPIPVSAHSGLGLTELWQHVIAMAEGSSFYDQHGEFIEETPVHLDAITPDDQENIPNSTYKTKARTKRGATGRAIVAKKQKDLMKIRHEKNKSNNK